MTHPIDGILLLDKPAGLTSNRALQIVKRLFQADKAGHTGSLDPLATGMLPICLGQATKLSGYLLAARKRYRVMGRLGLRTETGDADGRVVDSVGVPSLREEELASVLDRFVGEIEQTPPMYSALKHKGQRLYTLARRGEQVNRPRRQVTIHEIEFLSYSAPDLTLTVACSKGTYIRSLMEDIATELGTLAHVVELRRLAVEPFAGDAMHTLDTLEARAERGLAALDELLLPVDRPIDHWPRLDLPEAVCARLTQGQRVPADGSWPESRVRMYSPAHGFFGIGEVVAGELAPRRVFQCLGGSRQPTFAGTIPRFQKGARG